MPHGAYAASQGHGCSSSATFGDSAYEPKGEKGVPFFAGILDQKPCEHAVDSKAAYTDVQAYFSATFQGTVGGFDSTPRSASIVARSHSEYNRLDS
jgi:hypothetical protein